jgi:NAD(P)-dependent dehydrogenase (short-subunit alcohol dehydrogenase family)
MPLEEQEAMLDINLGSVMIAARTGIPAILRGSPPRHGRFLAVSSAAATRALPMLAAYCAAKAGVNAFVRTLAVELAGTGVTANVVSPGSTATAILDESARIYGLEAATTFASQQPLGRLIEPAEVARTLVWLASDDTDAITGATIDVDGGLSL